MGGSGMRTLDQRTRLLTAMAPGYLDTTTDPYTVWYATRGLTDTLEFNELTEEGQEEAVQNLLDPARDVSYVEDVSVQVF